MSPSEFERRVAAALHAPVATDRQARHAIMDRVRALSPDERPARRRGPLGGRSMRHTIAGAALAAGLGSLGTVSSLLPGGRAGASGQLATAVIGDSVSATLRDTVRLVRLIFDDASAHRVAAVGDFNGWSADSTPLGRDAGTHRWTATIALRDGAHRYAFVVDGIRWAIDPGTPRVRGDDGRLYSLLHVRATAN